jgi:hypothetical protein
MHFDITDCFGNPTYWYLLVFAVLGFELQYSVFCEGFFPQTICPGLASNHDPPDLCLPRSWDYRREPQAPGNPIHFIELIQKTLS